MIDLVEILQEAARRDRLSQFNSPDAFTRFSGEARFIERALEMARAGTPGINNKSVFTSFAQVDDKDGNTQVVIFPNVQEQGGKLGSGGFLTDFTDKSVGPRRDALQEAIKNNNVLRIPAGNRGRSDSADKIREAEDAAKRFTSGFSAFLGNQKKRRQ